MTPEERLLSINYLNVLSALEQACRNGGEDPIEDGDRGRLRDYGKALQTLLRKAFSLRDRDMARMSEALGIVATSVRRKEKLLLRAIDRATEPERGFSGEETADRLKTKVKPKDMAALLVATVLGLHSENRHDPDVAKNVQRCLESAVENILAPAIAWNVLADIDRQHPNHHAEILKAAAETVGLGGVGANPERVSWSKGVVTLPSLILFKAWARMLRDHFGISHQDIVRLLGDPAAKALGGKDVPTLRERLIPTVKEALSWGEHASERTLAIRLAGRSSARIDRRIELLKAASSEEAKAWNALLQHNPEQALTDIRRKIRDRTINPLQAAGKAFWLSRHCFRATEKGSFVEAQGDTTINTTLGEEACRRLDLASSLVMQLLDQAAQHPTVTSDQVLLLRRFQAGFATNPRYWRGKEVLARAPELVNTYRSLAGHKPGLVAHFEARLALQKWYANQDSRKLDKAVPSEPLRAYRKIFEDSPSLTEMIDAEAPIHLFPEVITLLTFGPAAGKKFNQALEDVDLILQCNFGVYMDIDIERAAIVGGLEQAKSWAKLLPSIPSPQTASA